MTSIKAEIEAGSVKVKYEGPAQFFEEGFKDAIENLIKAFGQLSAQGYHDREAPAVSIAATPAPHSNGASPFPDGAGRLKGTTKSICAALGAKTGPDLVLSACAKLHFIDGKDTLERSEILAAAKEDTTLYNENIGKNFSNLLNGLVKRKKLNETAKGKFSLMKSEIDSIEPKIREVCCA